MRLKAKYHQWQGNKAIRSFKSELDRGINIRESLLADFEKLDQALAGLHIKHGLAENEKDAQEITKQIGHFERTRRNLRMKFNEMVAMQDAQKEQAAEMERQFRALEGMLK